MRWLYHLIRAADVPAAGKPLAPPSLTGEGFVHCSYQPAVRESATLYFAGESPRVLRIDPRRLDVRLALDPTPRGPMPHVYGPIPSDAIRETIALDDVDDAPDELKGTRFLVAAFRGMTLLDLVGMCDPLGRLRAAGIDVESNVEVFSLDDPASFEDWATRFSSRGRPDSLAEADVVLYAGGLASRVLAKDPHVIALVRSFPRNRLVASVCTGALFLGEAGMLRGKRATTHFSEVPRLPGYGATHAPGRVVIDGNVITGGGVTCGIDVGLAVIERIYGEAARSEIARRMVWPL